MPVANNKVKRTLCQNSQRWPIPFQEEESDHMLLSTRRKYLASNSGVSGKTKKNEVRFPLHPDIDHTKETHLGRSYGVWFWNSAVCVQF